MIKIFRKIRYKLMEKGKTTQYFKYAIGEIILVVIGILIALQINNWNEERKTAKFEKEILSQIKENLVQDRENLVDIKYWHQKALAASAKLINDSLRTKHLDSVPYWLGEVVHFSRFQPLTNSYEALKSTGINTVKNPELRKSLGVYYDDHANHIVKALGDVEYAFNNHWLPLMESHATNFEFRNILEVNNIEEFFSETNVWRLLMLNRDNIAASITRLEFTMASVDKTLSLMPTHLQTNQ
ncbi:DUF6090 family protein [Winogradskyella aurantia]|nr:DUF6090 family protein [Winogradskyella aurantia]